jgi:hypothetical protein
LRCKILKGAVRSASFLLTSPQIPPPGGRGLRIKQSFPRSHVKGYDSDKKNKELKRINQFLPPTPQGGLYDQIEIKKSPYGGFRGENKREYLYKHRSL